MPWTILLFILFGGMAVGCALAVVAQRNPLYSAISLIGVFISLACLYVVLAAPFIAAVQIIVYAGAIMVLVIFVIMLLNVEEEVRRPLRLRYLLPLAVGLAAVLMAQTAFMLTLGAARAGDITAPAVQDAGSTRSIGRGLFTEYLLPFEVTSVLILMALVGAITLARRTDTLAGAGGDELSGPPGAASAPAPAGDGPIQPGFTAETGRAFARYQIEKTEAEGRTPERRQEEEE
ncbi:MAG TPA: NADH-quinone oxidoreductase subunit J [Pyrinomonadaceae bacterium]|nr:NADH-quinone oxidoreductase subunit J [Pyrinomonadaceae bacterium]